MTARPTPLNEAEKPMPGLPRKISVVIIGAGPVGLTTACLLATYGVEFVVLDRADGPLDLPRAIVLDDEGARTLQAFGLDKTYVARTMPGLGARYYLETGECFAETGTGVETYGFAKRSYFFQPELEEALRKRLAELAPGTLRYNAEVTGIDDLADGARVKVQTASGTREIAADWVLACDGGSSPTRERLGIAMDGNTYGQDWIVVDTANDPDTEPVSRFYCSANRAHVSIPAPHRGRRYEFMMLPGEVREQVLQEAFLANLIAPFRKLQAADVIRKTVYTFHARIADRFRVGRVFLLGDAAHLTPPFAGQGMNAGLRDAHNLAWKIASVARAGADPSLLDSYEAERRAPAWEMIQLAVAMGKIIMPMTPGDSAFRELLLNALDPFPKVRDYLIQMRFKPRPRYGAGAFLDLDAPQFDADLTGQMIPQPRVRTDLGDQPLDDVTGPGFTLIAQDAAGNQALSALGALGWDSFAGLRLSCLTLDTSDGALAPALRPIDRMTARPFRTHRDQIMLVRPDRYTAATFAPDRLQQSLQRYLQMLGVDDPTVCPATRA